MKSQNMTAATAVNAEFLDSLAESAHTNEALEKVDACRRLIVRDGIFSISQNATTKRDPADEIQLRRFYTSAAGTYPVNGTKRKLLTPWTQCLFTHGRVFIGEGEQILSRTFDDFEQMREFDARSVVNVPLMVGRQCYATFNVFGTRDQWLPEEILGIRLLALAAAPWVPALPSLYYDLAGLQAAAPSEGRGGPEVRLPS